MVKKVGISNKAIILLVDDDQLSHTIIKDVLDANDYEIIPAHNSNETFKVLKEIKPDLILLDIVMPGLDGHEVCLRLKENEKTKDIPVIFLTAKTDTQDIVWGFQLGAVDYIKKPFNSEELNARVHTHVELKRAKDRQRKLIDDLKKALAEVKQLSSLLPICAHCKKVRDDDGYWSQVEEYISKITGTAFTHGICPGCVRELYPDMADFILEDDEEK